MNITKEQANDYYTTLERALTKPQHNVYELSYAGYRPIGSPYVNGKGETQTIVWILAKTNREAHAKAISHSLGKHVGRIKNLGKPLHGDLVDIE